jgi:hypothetical protein
LRGWYTEEAKDESIEECGIEVGVVKVLARKDRRMVVAYG